LLTEQNEATILYAYMADGWTGNIMSKTVESRPGVLVDARGRIRREFLLEHAFLRARLPCGQRLMQNILSRPRPMTLGKGAWNVFTSCKEFLGDFLRGLGATGLTVSWYVLDGALKSAFQRHMHAAHRLKFEEDMMQEEEQAEGYCALEASCLDWDLYTHCKSHVSQLCQFKALWRVHTAPVSKDAHLMIKSIRTNLTDMHKKVDAVIDTCVHYAEKAVGEALARKAWWSFLGVKEKFMDIFQEVDPHFAGDMMIYVNRDLANQPNGRMKIRLCLLYGWRVFDWSDTRWLKSGASSRCFFKAEATGISAGVNEVLADGNMSHMYLSVYRDRTSFPVRKLLAVAAVSSLVVEVPHLRLMEDDRWLRYGAETRPDVEKKMDEIIAYPPLVWQRLASLLCGPCDWTEVRSFCIDGALIAIGCLDRDAYSMLETEPFSLTQGSIDENLERVKATPMEEIKDEVTRSIKILYELNPVTQRPKEALEEMKDAPCTINVPEQAHTWNACLTRRHDYTENVLIERGCLGKSRSLFMPDKHERVKAQMQMKIAALENRNPDKVTGRHMFFKQEAKTISSRSGGDRSDLFDQMKDGVKRHAADWDALSLQEQLAFDRMARFAT